MAGFFHAKAMVAFCTESYGEKTGIGYESYEELKRAFQSHVAIVPLKLCNTYPPQPPDEAGQFQNAWVLNDTKVRIDDPGMCEHEKVARTIAEATRSYFQSELPTP